MTYIIHGNLDDSKTEILIDEPENICNGPMCGNECEKDFCSEQCFKNWINE